MLLILLSFSLFNLSLLVLAQQKLKKLAHYTQLVQLGRLHQILCHELANPVMASLAKLEELAHKINPHQIAPIKQNLNLISKILATFNLNIFSQANFSFARDDTKIKLEQIFSHIKNSAQYQASQTQVQLVYQLEPSLLKTNIDSQTGQLLYHILINLIINAVEAYRSLATPKISKPPVLVKGFCQKNQLTVTVQDWAGGIDTKIFKKIFKPFFSTKTGPSNLGLGLYLCQQLIKKLNGQLIVQRQPLGSCFRLEITLDESPVE